MDKLKRYQVHVFATLFVAYAVYNYNRKSVSLVMPQLRDEGLDKNEAGWIISSQHISFAVSKFLGGVLSDRVSARVLFSTGLTFCGLVTLLFASATSPSAFAFFWFLNGLGQGCGWPACSKLLKQWFSPVQFGTWWSVLSSSANLSGGLSPFFNAFLVLHYGWRTSLVVSGSMSVGLGMVAFVSIVNTPTDAGLLSFTSEFKEKDKGETSSGDSTVGDLLKSPSLWLVSFCFMVVTCIRTCVSVWGQLYLIEDRKHTHQCLRKQCGNRRISGAYSGRIFNRFGPKK